MASAAGVPNLKITGNVTQDAVTGAILLSVQITQELNQHSVCKVVCRRSDATDEQRISAESPLGHPMQVVAYDQDGAEVPVFDGYVIEAELTYEISGSYEARLTAVTRSYFMDQTPRTAYYEQMDVQGVAKKLIDADGLQQKTSTIDVSGQTRDFIQWGETDWNFLKRIADDCEGWIRPTGGGIEILDSFQNGDKLNWRDEHSLLQFKTRGKLSSAGFNGAHYDPYKMESKTYEDVEDDAEFFGDSAGNMLDAAKSGSVIIPSGYVHQRGRVGDLDGFEKRLKKESRRSAGGRVEAYGESMNPKLKPGDTVDIDGLPDANGTFGLTKVVHTWAPTGYSNQFFCTPWKKFTSPQPPPVHTWPGVVNGRVEDNNDPEGMGRIKVRFFWQEENVVHWARMMTPHAGADRGFLFLPEVGDEVVIAFGDGDVEKPVILGCLWNGVDKPPREEFWGGENSNNDVKRIVTKSGHRIHIVDKQGKESIVIATPKELKIVMMEKADETGRSMIMLHSENGDITLSAPNGRVHVHGKFVSEEAG